MSGPKSAVTAQTNREGSVQVQVPVLANPVLAGFHPDPSIVQVGDAWYLATSSFEYLPGIPIHRSTDLITWTLVGHVVTRPGQLQMDGVPTGGGAWAPTIRYYGGLFHVVVCDAMGRGMLHFTTPDPAGEWSDGAVVNVNGIDPDLAWDDDGICFMTYSGLSLSGEAMGQHHGILQVRIDLATGLPLEEPRSMWSGTGLIFPEAPHLYRIGDWWYLLLAEGGTERGHAVSIARSTRPDGPFEGCPANPVLSARSTDRTVQNTGHGDLVQDGEDGWHLVLLGMRISGLTRSFAPLGRETFATPVHWEDGWPVMQPVVLDAEIVAATAPVCHARFGTAALGGLGMDGIGVDGEDWIGIRRLPAAVSSRSAAGLVIGGEGRNMNHPAPAFVGRRVSRLDARTSALVDVQPSSAGTSRKSIAGLVLRYDEVSHYEIEIRDNEVVARACLPSLLTEHRVPRPAGDLLLWIEARPGEGGYAERMTSDWVSLGFDFGGVRTLVGRFDGRYLTAETTCSFTGRVAGVYCEEGILTVRTFSETGIQ